MLVVMSGDHVQRGEAAIIDKYARAGMALDAGADLVLELPSAFATGSAQYFARGAVSALLHTGACDALLFGSESGDIEALKKTEAVIADPEAGKGRFTPFDERPGPNDLLAAEYLKALDHFRSDMETHTIKRIGPGHDSLLPSDGFLSASALREYILSGEDACIDFMPEGAVKYLNESLITRDPMCFKSYSSLLFYALLSGKDSGYGAYFDVFDDLSDKILSRLEGYTDAESFAQSLKSKDISLSHIRRALLHILLKIRNDEVHKLIDIYGYCPYLRILGLKKDSALLKRIRKNCDRPLIAKAADAGKLLDGAALLSFEKDVFCSELYSRTASKNGGFLSEYRRGVVVL